jgi:hypothetical protein
VRIETEDGKQKFKEKRQPSTQHPKPRPLQTTVRPLNMTFGYLTF